MVNILSALSMTFVVLMLIVFWTVMRIKRIDIRGKRPIAAVPFLAGKIASFSLWTLLLLASYGVPLTDHLPFSCTGSASVLRPFGMIFLMVASVVFYLSFRSLGLRTKFGLPDQSTAGLQEEGLYRYSRNPMYLAFILLDIATVLFVPSLITVITAAVAIVTHHMITLAEETFLLQAYGQEYASYTRRVRRYL